MICIYLQFYHVIDIKIVEKSDFIHQYEDYYYSLLITGDNLKPNPSTI